MIESPDPGMLKSLAEADGWVAVYALPQVPFIKILPLVKWGLLLQDKTQKLVGYVTEYSAQARLAQAPWDDGSQFVTFYRPTGITDYDTQTFQALWRSVVDFGQRLAMPEEVEVSDEQS